jgi:hypothetical protein
MGVEIIDGPQNLFDVEMGDIDGKTAESADFFPEVSRVYRLMNKKMPGNERNVGFLAKRENAYRDKIRVQTRLP